MELGALVCTARTPRCARCPVTGDCRWVAEGRPAADVVRRPQGYQGTDRQARGQLLAVLRDAAGPVPPEALDDVWPDATQRRRALHGLITDGLVEPNGDGRYRLPA